MVSMYSMKRSVVDLIKEKLNILDVVSPYVELKKAGRSYKGKSPFNMERTPSFFVHPDKGFFYDFSAGFGGDIFTFIQRIERVDFPTALKILAERAGVPLQSDPRYERERKERDELIRIHEDAAKWYEARLAERKDALSYLKERGVSDASIRQFRIGFAPSSWDALFRHLREEKGYAPEQLVRSGLVGKREQGGYYDRFRSRILFPLFNEKGEVIAFSGRIFGEDHPAKYLNSPETPLFEKSKLLYPYHLAKASLAKDDRAILVEGQFDVVLSHQAGYRNTLAVSGTALSPYQLSLIKRFTKRVSFALDADAAGMRATRRSVALAYRYGFEVSILVLPKGEDPADIIRRSKDAWDIIVSEPVGYIDYEILRASEEVKDFHSRARFVREEIFPVLAEMESAIQRDHELEKLASFLGTSSEAVRDDFRTFLSEWKPSEQEEFPSQRGKEGTEEERKGGSSVDRSEVERELKLFLVAQRELFPDAFLESEARYRSLAEKLGWGELDTVLDTIPQEEKEMILFVVEEEGMTGKQLSQKIFDSFLFLRKLQLEERYAELEERIRQESAQGTDHIPRELIQESQEILRELDQLKNGEFV